VPREAPGFKRLQRGPAEVWVAPRHEAAVEALGLLQAGALERHLSGRPGEGGRGPTARLPLGTGGEQLLLRLLLHGGLLGRGLDTMLLGLGRPLRELTVTSRLRAAGAPVPEPVLVLGVRRAGPFWSAAVGTRVEEGTQNARRFLEQAPAPAAVTRAAEAAGRAVRRFHDAGGEHADLHLGNLLVRNDADTCECVVIDLDRARCTTGATPARRLAELARLYRSLIKRGLLTGLGEAGVARFLAAYLDDDRTLGDAMLRHLPRERLRLRLHRLHYR
jgi:3-deoxy-D-manno-octulosonic acid kinase